MKNARAVGLLGLTAGASVALFSLITLTLQGCSSDSGNGGGGGGTVNGGDAGGGGVELQHPPAAPSGPATSSTEERNFAVDKIFIGTTDRNGVASENAWKNFGYDLDNKATTKASTDVCTPVSKSAQEDGARGIDNSFGANILRLLPYLTQTPQEDINAAITKGSFTMLLDVKGLSSEANQTATGASGFLLGGSKFEGTPSFGPSDNWPVLFESVTDPADARSAKIRFPDAYVSGGVWVNNAAGDVPLSLDLQAGTVNLTIRKTIITFEHNGAGGAVNGTIAGVLSTDEFIDALKPLAAGLNQCPVVAQASGLIRQASDIMADGTNAPGKPCNGISIGLGFTAKQIAPPQKVAPKLPPGDGKTCP
ncbi:hypothetical protein LZC95_22905 [Pendulispora brunnea]|uniref:Secreted protein n=1 Tax=Pendulispora brunnea TaxID=2905690 RepID=A0ABZ2KQS0_9BACT